MLTENQNFRLLEFEPETLLPLEKRKSKQNSHKSSVSILPKINNSPEKLI
jgi:hypothetical protein